MNLNLADVEEQHTMYQTYKTNKTCSHTQFFSEIDEICNKNGEEVWHGTVYVVWVWGMYECDWVVFFRFIRSPKFIQLWCLLQETASPISWHSTWISDIVADTPLSKSSTKSSTRVFHPRWDQCSLLIQLTRLNDACNIASGTWWPRLDPQYSFQDRRVSIYPYGYIFIPPAHVKHPTWCRMELCEMGKNHLQNTNIYFNAVKLHVKIIDPS